MDSTGAPLKRTCFGQIRVGAGAGPLALPHCFSLTAGGSTPRCCWRRLAERACSHPRTRARSAAAGRCSGPRTVARSSAQSNSVSQALGNPWVASVVGGDALCVTGDAGYLLRLTLEHRSAASGVSRPATSATIRPGIADDASSPCSTPSVRVASMQVTRISPCSWPPDAAAFGEVDDSRYGPPARSYGSALNATLFQPCWREGCHDESDSVVSTFRPHQKDRHRR